MAETFKLECVIQDIKQVENTTIQIISIKFKLGQREWFKGFRLNFDRPLSMEEFKKMLTDRASDPDPEKNIWPLEDTDFLAFIKEEADKPFTLEVEKPPIPTPETEPPKA